MPTCVNFAPSMLARWAGLSIRTRCASSALSAWATFSPQRETTTPARFNRSSTMPVVGDDVTEEARGDHVLGVRARDGAQLGIDGQRRQPAPRGGPRSAASSMRASASRRGRVRDVVARRRRAPRAARRRRRRSARWRARRARWRRRSSPPPGRRRARRPATTTSIARPDERRLVDLAVGTGQVDARVIVARGDLAAQPAGLAGTEAARERIQARPPCGRRPPPRRRPATRTRA